MECISLMETSQGDSKDKKVDQPPQAKKAKVKTTTVDLPIENQLVWQIGKDMLNLFIENEVNSYLPKLKTGLVDLRKICCSLNMGNGQGQSRKDEKKNVCSFSEVINSASWSQNALFLLSERSNC